MSTYHEALDQLQAFGLQVESIETGRMRRCKVADDPKGEKRGWYCIHAISGNDGSLLYVGQYGIWRGDDNHSQKLSIKGNSLSKDELAAIKKRMADDRKRLDAQRKRDNERAAARANHVWSKLSSESGHCAYLDAKGIANYGLRFTSKGNALVPMHDIDGRIQGLQILFGDKKRIKSLDRNKDFWPKGLAKKGHFFMIGIPAWIILLCEGYATGASLHYATGLPVVVAFDAGNLLPVAELLRKRYRMTKILVCADDDYLTDKNPGVSRAQAVAIAIPNSAFVAPTFKDERDGKKITDFNDLHQREGAHTVRAQIQAAIDALRWTADNGRARLDNDRGEGTSHPDHPIKPWTLDDLLSNFVKIYDQEAVFDLQNRCILALSTLRSNVPDNQLVRAWKAHPDQHEPIFLRQVGFDPTMADKSVFCNFWRGWPVQAKPGSCARLLELLSYLCNSERDNGEAVYEWMLKWLAYPIQHPGAKMQTSVVMHGPQGAGKNLFFEHAMLPIYGIYGGIVDQAALESQFNDWAAEKLLLLADEVVARAELYHVKNRLKSFITGDRIRINPKSKIAYEEKNHVNIVFLSNEVQPLVLDHDDRRYAVIWTPPKLPPEIYDQVGDELREGGSAALHQFLLDLDLGDFKPWTPPPLTQAKRDLIDISRDSVERFLQDWLAELIPHIPVIPCRTEQIYQLYFKWCTDHGINRPAPSNIMLGKIGKTHGLKKSLARFGIGPPRIKQATFVFPEKTQSKPAANETDAYWLSKCVDEFSEAYATWTDNRLKYNDY